MCIVLTLQIQCAIINSKNQEGVDVVATTNITIRMDEELKKQAEDLFSDLGLNLTTAFTAFARQAVREQGIPFVLSRNIPNEETKKAIEDARRV